MGLKMLQLHCGCIAPTGAIAGLIGAQLVFNVRPKSWTGLGTLYHKEMRTIAKGQYDVQSSTGTMLIGLAIIVKDAAAPAFGHPVDSW